MYMYVCVCVCVLPMMGGYHPKHVEQFTEIRNKPYIIASCWTIIDTT